MSGFVVVMPKLGDIMESGVVQKRLKAEGEWVARGEPLFELESEKVSFVVDAAAEGYVHWSVEEGAELAVGEPVAELVASGSAVRDPDNDGRA